jgi:hypothetical protein
MPHWVLVLKDGYAINVQWYTQNVIGVLEYVVEGGESAMPVVQSSADLILTGFTMHQVYGTSILVCHGSAQLDQIEWLILNMIQELEEHCKLMRENGIEVNMAIDGDWMIRQASKYLISLSQTFNLWA